MGAVALVVSLAGATAGYLVATSVLFPGVEASAGDLEVPDLRGLEFEAVLEVLDDGGFEVGMVDSIRHPDRPEGRILGQSPLPGQTAIRGAEVDVTVSTGPERRPVPDVVRLPPDRARQVLEGSGFEVEVDSVDADVPAGWLAGVFPEAGTEVTLPGEVTLEVSLGPATVEMPLLTGLNRDEAERILEERGLFVLEVEHRFPLGFGGATVVTHDPPAGEEVDRGTPVRLVVGRLGAGHR